MATLLERLDKLIKDGKGDQPVKPGKVILPHALWYAHALKVPKDRRRSRAPQETLAEALERVGRLDVVEHGWNVIPFDTDMFTHMHKPKASCGAWWYDVRTGAFEYSNKVLGPYIWGTRERYFSVTKHYTRNMWKHWIPGIVFRYPAKDAIRPGTPKELSWQAWKREERLRARKTYITVYSQVFEQHHRLSGRILKDLVEQGLVVCTLPIDDAVDYFGNSLVRTR